MLDVRFGRRVWLIGTNLVHLYRFRYTLMSRRLMHQIPLQLLRGVCAIGEGSVVALVVACAGYAFAPVAVAAVLVQLGAERVADAALVVAAERCDWALPICHLDRLHQMIQSRSLGQLGRGVVARRFELLLQPVRCRQQSAHRRRK